MTALPVYFETRTVGTIEIHADGPSFVYDPQWLRTRGAFQISAQMPLSPLPVRPQQFLPWAANLLPEGQQLRTMGSILDAEPGDVISILKEIGRDTAGALSVGKPGASTTANWRPVGSEIDLERIIEELPAKPFLAGEDGVSMSLAGVQSKIGVALDGNGRVCIPLEGSPSTHILKPDAPQLWGGVQNEALCLVLARLCGLSVARATTGKAGKRIYLLVTRYDRLQQGDRWRRLHQEDFCQALGKPPSAKYEANQTGVKGPTLADMFALTRNAMSAPAIMALLDGVIFNVVVCNTDAHAKNYSILISGQGFRLAPLYDVMCAAAWPNVTRNLAQTIAGKNRGEHLKRRHWEQFARDCGLSPERTVDQVKALAGSVLTKVRDAATEVEAMPAGTHPLLPQFCQAIEQRARAMIDGLADEAPKRSPKIAAAAPGTPTPGRRKRTRATPPRTDPAERPQPRRR